MRWRVTLHVPVIPVLRYYLPKLIPYILDNTRVSMLIYHDPGRGVRHINIANPVCDATLSHDIPYPACHVLEFHLTGRVWIPCFRPRFHGPNRNRLKVFPRNARERYSAGTPGRY